MAITKSDKEEAQKRVDSLNLKQELFEKANVELNNVKDKSD